jgi:hypothetical protein
MPPRRRNPTIRLTGFGKPKTLSPAVEAFLRAFYDASYPSPFSPNERTERALSGIDAVVEITPQYAGVHIDEVRALTKKQGEGTKAMRFLTDLADKHGVELYLYAKPFGNEAMDLDTLVRFYRRHGFREMEEEDEDGEGTEMVRRPRRQNPARKPSQTDTPAFQRWFGASKVVNAKGEPRVMYHGTHADFDVFDTTGTRRAKSFGAMFTPSKAYATNYGRKEYGGKVLAVYLRIENPLDAKNKKHDREWEANRLPQEGWVQYAHRAGYDGAITMLNEYVVFDPTQIKSATANVGTFDPADPSILRNPASRNPRRNPARTKKFSNTPLTAEETKLFGRATDYLTEWVCDGWRSLPARIAELEEKTTALTNSEKRELIDWFYRNAPGDW